MRMGRMEGIRRDAGPPRGGGAELAAGGASELRCCAGSWFGRAWLTPLGCCGQGMRCGLVEDMLSSLSGAGDRPRGLCPGCGTMDRPYPEMTVDGEPTHGHDAVRSAGPGGRRGCDVRGCVCSRSISRQGRQHRANRQRDSARFNTSRCDGVVSFRYVKSRRVLERRMHV